MLWLASCSPTEDSPAAAASSGGQADPFDTGEWRRTESGLEYRVLRAGDAGEPPAAMDKVTMRWFSRVAGGKPLASPADGAAGDGVVGALPFAGWNEAVALMTPGAHYLFKVPPPLAYGAQGFVPDVPPNAVIHLDVELVAITRIPRFRRLQPQAVRRADPGLAYEVLVEGEGEPPQAADRVRYHVTVWSLDGVLVESSHYGHEPYAGPVEEQRLAIVRHALQLMRPGGKALFRAPDALTFPVAPKERHPALTIGKPSLWLFELVAVER